MIVYEPANRLFIPCAEHTKLGQLCANIHVFLSLLKIQRQGLILIPFTNQFLPNAEQSTVLLLLPFTATSDSWQATHLLLLYYLSASAAKQGKDLFLCRPSHQATITRAGRCAAAAMHPVAVGLRGHRPRPRPARFIAAVAGARASPVV